MNKIIAIVGMCGSGKSVAVDFFLKKGYQKVYFGGITYEKMKEQNIPFSVDNEIKMREGLRAEYGMGAYAILSLPKIKELLKSGNVVIDGLYSWDELKILNEEFKNQIQTIAVVTDKKIRYERVGKRVERAYSLKDVIRRDTTEIENVAKGGPIAYADYFILNNGTVAEMEERLENILSSL